MFKGTIWLVTLLCFQGITFAGTPSQHRNHRNHHLHSSGGHSSNNPGNPGNTPSIPGAPSVTANPMATNLGSDPMPNPNPIDQTSPMPTPPLNTNKIIEDILKQYYMGEVSTGELKDKLTEAGVSDKIADTVYNTQKLSAKLKSIQDFTELSKDTNKIESEIAEIMKSLNDNLT